MTTSIFPGQYAQSVAPNDKCNGCLHYEKNASMEGACTIGLRPWLCGDGEHHDTGYAPLDRLKLSMPGDGVSVAQADTGLAQLNMIPMKLTVLGEEHVTMVKSIIEKHEAIEKSQCPLCQSRGISKSYNTSSAVGAQTCRCRRIASKSIAHDLWKALENKERVHLEPSDVLRFVRGVRKGLSPFDIAKEALYDGVTMSKSDDGENVTLGDNNDLAKSLYGDDWTTQFLGTDLFDEAAKLREQEIEACEAELKARIERTKRMKAEAAKRAKEQSIQPDYDYDARYAAEEKLRVAKARLMLKLQKHRQKQFKKSVDDNNVEKGQGALDRMVNGPAKVKKPKTIASMMGGGGYAKPRNKRQARAAAAVDTHTTERINATNPKIAKGGLRNLPEAHAGRAAMQASGSGKTPHHEAAALHTKASQMYRQAAQKLKGSAKQSHLQHADAHDRHAAYHTTQAKKAK